MKTVVEHLMELIRRPSVSTMTNRAVIDYAETVLRGVGWTTSIQTYVDEHGVEKSNMAAAPEGEDPNDPVAALAFVCHTDTVPYSLDWVHAVDPLLAEGVVYGCGACDVKGFLACLLSAAEISVGFPLQRGVRIVLTADEEVGCIGAKHLVESKRIAPKRVVIGEPTSLHPARAGKGYCLAEVTVFGAEAHSAHPQQGRSAIYDAAWLIAEIERLAEQMRNERNEFFSPPFTTLNVGTVQGGTAKNVVPGQCRLQLEWRPIPGEKAEAVPNAVRELIGRLEGVRPGLRCGLNVVRLQGGFETQEDAVLVQTMQELTRRDAVAIPFASEANVFSSIAEEIVVFGPGDMRTAHSARECVPVAELEEAVSCLRSLMQDF